MGTVPPRIAPLLRQWEQSLAEDMPYFKDATNRPISITWSRLMSHRSEWEGSVRDGFVYDGYGGRISVEDMTPIWQIGKPEPTGYMDRSGNFYLVEDRPLAGQYEDAAVDYERC